MEDHTAHSQPILSVPNRITIFCGKFLVLFGGGVLSLISLVLLFSILVAIQGLIPHAKPIFHSDRGFQYTSKTFRKKLENQEMEQSMSRVGHCIDNGPIESFWGIIKSEMYQMYEIIDEVSLRYAIKDYLRFYSEERPQDRDDCKTPSEVRQKALSSDVPTEYPIPENKRISKYKEKWCA